MAENCKTEGGGEDSASSSTLKIPSVSIDIQAVARGNVQSGWRLERQMHKVPKQWRLMQQQQQNLYDPMMVSIGPYHHGKLHLLQLEKFKHLTLELFLSGADHSDKVRETFYTKINEKIDEIRNCYFGVSVDVCNDATLSQMMLLDASFIINYMMANTDDKIALTLIFENIGILTGFLAGSELNLLENQIPYWVIKFLFCLRYGEDEWKKLLRRHLSEVCFGDFNKLTTIPWEEGEGDDRKEPLHLLEATQRMLVQLDQQSSDFPTILVQLDQQSSDDFTILVQLDQQSSDFPTGCPFFMELPSRIFKIFGQYICSRCWKKQEDNVDSKILSRQFHSATYLKTKGIHCKPSSSSLKDVRFKSHVLYGNLLLPVRFVNTSDKVLFSNLIAFEWSPGISFDVPVTSYINFMKRLIENPKDVEELREQGILFSSLASDEEVVKLFQEIVTMGAYIDFFDKVKANIKKHCNYKSKTWIAELINSKFQSPWTITALLAATVLLILTFLQTLYTMRAA